MILTSLFLELVIAPTICPPGTKSNNPDSFNFSLIIFA